MSKFHFTKPLDKKTFLAALQQQKIDVTLYGDMSPEDMLEAIAGVDLLDSDLGTVLDKEHAKAVSKVLLEYEKIAEKENKEKPDKDKVARPDILVTPSTGSPRTLEPKEFQAYAKATLDAKATSYDAYTVDTWTSPEPRGHNVGLTGEAKPIDNNKNKILGKDTGETIMVETWDGQRRTANFGETKPIKGGVYGGVKGVIVADGDLLDIYVTNDILNKMKPDAGKKGTHYPDKKEDYVYVMQQRKEGGAADELKVGFANDVDTFKDLQKSTYELDPKNAENTKDVEAANASRKAFVQNQGKYVKLTGDQYESLKKALQKKNDLTLDEFIAQEGVDKKTGKNNVVEVSPKDPENTELPQLVVPKPVEAPAPKQATPPGAGGAGPVVPTVEQKDATFDYAAAVYNINRSAKSLIGADATNGPLFAQELMKNTRKDSSFASTPPDVSTPEKFKAWIEDANAPENVKKLNSLYKNLNEEGKTHAQHLVASASDATVASSHMDAALPEKRAAVQTSVEQGMKTLLSDVDTKLTELQGKVESKQISVDEAKKAQQKIVEDKLNELKDSALAEHKVGNVAQKTGTEVPTTNAPVYTVQPGDTLFNIVGGTPESGAMDSNLQAKMRKLFDRTKAEMILNDPSKVPTDKTVKLALSLIIARKSGVPNADSIGIGQELILPEPLPEQNDGKEPKDSEIKIAILAMRSGVLKDGKGILSDNEIIYNKNPDGNEMGKLENGKRVSNTETLVPNVTVNATSKQLEAETQR